MSMARKILGGGLRGALTHCLQCSHSGICQVLLQGSASAAVHPPCILDTSQARWPPHSADPSTAVIFPVAAAVQDDTNSSRQNLSNILSLASTSHSQAAHQGMEVRTALSRCERASAALCVCCSRSFASASWLLASTTGTSFPPKHSAV